MMGGLELNSLTVNMDMTVQTVACETTHHHLSHPLLRQEYHCHPQVLIQSFWDASLTL